MLYTNEKLPISNRTISDRATGRPFTIAQVCLGTPCNNERLIVLTVPKTLQRIQKGMNPKVTVGYTESFNPRLHEGEDKDVYLLLTSKGNNAVGSNNIQVAAVYKPSVHVLRRGFGYEKNSTSGIHSWRTALFRFTGKEGLVRIHTEDAEEDQVLLISGSQVTRCTERTLKNVCRFKKVKLPAFIKWVDV